MRMSSATIPRYSSSSISSSASRDRKGFRNQPLELPLRWRDPPPEYSPLELPLRWRYPPPDRAVRNHPGPVFSDSYPFQHHPPPEDMNRRTPPASSTQLPPPDSPHDSLAFSMLQRNASLERTQQSHPPCYFNPLMPNGSPAISSPSPPPVSPSKHVGRDASSCEEPKVHSLQSIRSSDAHSGDVIPCWIGSGTQHEVEEDSNANTQHPDTLVPEAKTSSDVHWRPTTAAGSSTTASSDHSENSNDLDHHHRWPAARSRQSSLLTKSMDCSAERNERKSTVQLLRHSMLLDGGSSKALFESAKLYFFHLEIERLSISNVQRLDWVALGNKPLQDLIFRLQIHQQHEEILEFHVPLNHEHKGSSIQNEILPASFGGNTASSNRATLQGLVFPSIAQNHTLFHSVLEAAQLLRTLKEIHVSRVGTLVWNNNILTIGGIGDASLIGVQMLDEKSTDKVNPTPCSQATRGNVATDFGQLVVDDFIAEIVEGDRFAIQVLHLLESTKQEQQHELYKACEAVSLPRDDILGRGKDKEFVMQWLRKPSNEHLGTDLYRNISLLAIVGHGVMGQSTLLQHVYEDEMIKVFDLKLWGCVFNNFDVDKIITDMLKSLKMSRPPLDTFYAFQMNLKSEIISKGFLRMLDDLWDEEEERNKTKWENVLASLSFGIWKSDLSFAVDFTRDLFYAKNSYPPPNWQIEMLVQFKDSKVQPPPLDWGKPIHVVILKSAFKVFDPGICLSPYLPSNNVSRRRRAF